MADAADADERFQASLLPEYWNLLFVQTLASFKPSYSPEHMGSTAQAVAYLANSPAARAAHH